MLPRGNPKQLFAFAVLCASDARFRLQLPISFDQTRNCRVQSYKLHMYNTMKVRSGSLSNIFNLAFLRLQLKQAELTLLYNDTTVSYQGTRAPGPFGEWLREPRTARSAPLCSHSVRHFKNVLLTT